MKREIEVTPTVKELAEAFAALGSHEQALFICLVADIFHGWGSYQWDTQILSIADVLANAGETSKGLAWARLLGESVTPLPSDPQDGG